MKKTNNFLEKFNHKIISLGEIKKKLDTFPRKKKEERVVLWMEPKRKKRMKMHAFQ